nr:sigmaNS [Reptilian orthoreovirus]
MAASHRVGVSRVVANNRAETLFPNLYLLKCQLTSDSQSVAKGASAYFGGIKNALRHLNPLPCVAVERTIRKVDVPKLLSRPNLSLTDRILLVTPQPGQMAGLSVNGLQLVRQLLTELMGEDASVAERYIPQMTSPMNPMAMARGLALLSAGIDFELEEPYYRDGIVCHGMTEILAFQMCLPYCLDVHGDDVRLSMPAHTVERMLEQTTLLDEIDMSYGTDARSDQRMTQDQANDSSRSVNEWGDDRALERQTLKVIMALITLQMKLELDQLCELSVEARTASSVTSFGTQLLKQAGVLATIDWQMFKLMEAIVDAGRYMNPSTVAQKWKEIRAMEQPVGLEVYDVVMSNGAWQAKRNDATILTVRPAKIA